MGAVCCCRCRPPATEAPVAPLQTESASPSTESRTPPPASYTDAVVEEAPPAAESRSPTYRGAYLQSVGRITSELSARFQSSRSPEHEEKLATVRTENGQLAAEIAAEAEDLQLSPKQQAE